MNISRLFWKGLRGIMVFGMAFSTLGMQSHPAKAASGPASPIFLEAKLSPLEAVSTAASDCATQTVRITLASEQVSFCSPTSLPFSDGGRRSLRSKCKLCRLESSERIRLRQHPLRSHPEMPVGPYMPVYTAGKLDDYRQIVRKRQSAQTNSRLSAGPFALLVG